MFISRYLKGVAILIGFVIIVLLGALLLAVLEFVVGIALFVVAIGFLIIALFILPHYIGEKKETKSKSYTLKKVKG
jgi:hypothetical protein